MKKKSDNDLIRVGDIKGIIERYRDALPLSCYYSEIEKASIRGFLKVLEGEIHEQPTIEQPTWISVDDRLPDEHVDVQMCWKVTGTQATGFYTDESWYTYAEDGYYTDCEKSPTHWKVVGEPPKGDE